MVHIKYVGKRKYLPILYTTEKIVSDFTPADSQSLPTTELVLPFVSRALPQKRTEV